MANAFHATLRDNPPTVLQAALPSERTVTIVTDTLQDAMNIARSKCGRYETVVACFMTATDVIVDSSVLDGGD